MMISLWTCRLRGHGTSTLMNRGISPTDSAHVCAYMNGPLNYISTNQQQLTLFVIHSCECCGGPMSPCECVVRYCLCDGGILSLFDSIRDYSRSCNNCNEEKIWRWRSLLTGLCSKSQTHSSPIRQDCILRMRTAVLWDWMHAPHSCGGSPWPQTRAGSVCMSAD